MTVTGTIRDAAGAARASTRLRFVPIGNPQADSTGMLSAVPIIISTGSVGEFSQALEQGFYRVDIGHKEADKFIIAVDESTASADIVSLALAADRSEVYFPAFWLPSSGVNYQVSASYFMVRNKTTGLYNPLWIDGASGMEQFNFDPGTSPSYLSTTCGRLGLNYRFFHGKFQIYNPITGLFYTVRIVEDSGGPQVQLDRCGCESALDAIGYAPLAGGNFRLRNNHLQLLNISTHKWHSFFTIGADGAQQLEVQNPGEN